jgi:hypothetical protein
VGDLHAVGILTLGETAMVVFKYPRPENAKAINRAPEIEILVADEERNAAIPVYPPSRVGELMLTIMTHQKNIFRNAKVIDIGAGSGVLGIYAAMLGAADVTFVETATHAERCISRNIKNSKTSFNHNIFNGTLTEYKRKERNYNFDIVICNHFSAMDYAVKYGDRGAIIDSGGKDEIRNINDAHAHKRRIHGTWPGADRSLLCEVLDFMRNKSQSSTLITHMCEEQNPEEIMYAAHHMGFENKIYMTVGVQVEAVLFGEFAQEWQRLRYINIDNNGELKRKMYFGTFSLDNKK